MGIYRGMRKKQRCSSSMSSLLQTSLGCQGELLQCPLGNCIQRGDARAQRRLARGRTLPQHTSAPVLETCRVQKPSQALCTVILLRGKEQDFSGRGAAGLWIQGIHDISTKASGQSPLALPKKIPISPAGQCQATGFHFIKLSTRLGARAF